MATLSKGKTDYAEDQGEQGAQYGRDVEGEVDGDRLQGRSDDTEADIGAHCYRG